MTLKILGLAVAAVAMFAAPAHAETMLVQSDGAPHALQAWVKEMKTPTPDLTLTLLSSNCPDPMYESETRSCTRRGAYTIWFPEGTKEDLYHEIGHNVDYYVAPEWMRYRYRVLTRDWREWEADPNGPNELFASAYARCAVLGAHSKGDPNITLGPNLASFSSRRFNRICRMFQRLSSSPSPNGE